MRASTVLALCCALLRSRLDLLLYQGGLQEPARHQASQPGSQSACSMQGGPVRSSWHAQVLWATTASCRCGSCIGSSLLCGSQQYRRARQDGLCFTGEYQAMHDVRFSSTKLLQPCCDVSHMCKRSFGVW